VISQETERLFHEAVLKDPIFEKEDGDFYKQSLIEDLMESLVPVEIIEKKILLIPGQKVMLDSDLAELYGVETQYPIKAAKRNLLRFPDDFMFQLNKEESENLRFHFGTSSQWGGRRYFPYAFTE
jgi:hypothetical protein